MQFFHPKVIDVQNFFNSSKFSDLQLLLTDSSIDKSIVIYTHKMVLMSNSEMFNHILEELANRPVMDINLKDSGTIDDFLTILYSIYQTGNGLVLWNQNGSTKPNNYHNYLKYNIEMVKYYGFLPLYNFLMTNPFTENNFIFNIGKDKSYALRNELFNLNIFRGFSENGEKWFYSDSFYR